MPWRLPGLRFGLRTLLVGTLVAAIGVWLWVSPGRFRAYRNHQARKRIDPYELSIARSAAAGALPSELVAILGDSRLKHWNWIQDVELAPGPVLVSHSFDGVRIWDLKTLRQSAEYPAEAMALSGDGKVLFYSDPSGVIVSREMATQKKLREFPNLGGETRVALAVSFDGSVLAVETAMGGGVRTLRVLKTDSGEAIWSREVAGYSAGEIAMDDPGAKLAWLRDDKIQVTNCATGERIAEYGPLIDSRGQKYAVNDLAFDSGGSQLLVSSALPDLLAFDLKSGKQLVLVDSEGESSLDGLASLRTKGEMALHRGNRLLVYSESKDEAWRERIEIICASHVMAAALSQSLLAAGHSDYSLTLWSPAVPGQRWRMPHGGLGPEIWSLAFDSQGRWLATGGRDGVVRLWDTKRWSVLNQWQAHAGRVAQLVASPDGRLLISSSDDRSVVVWDTSTRREVAALGEFPSPSPVTLTSDGKRLSTSSPRPTQTGIWDLPAGTAESWPTNGIQSWQGSVFISPNGKWLVASDALYDAKSRRVLAKLPQSNMHHFLPRVVWSSDSARLAIPVDDTIEIYAAPSGKLQQTLRAGAGYLQDVAFHPTGEWLVASGLDAPVVIWHLATGKLVKHWNLVPTNGSVTQVQFSPDGQYLATVNANGTAYILSLDGVLSP